MFSCLPSANIQSTEYHSGNIQVIFQTHYISLNTSTSDRIVQKRWSKATLHEGCISNLETYSDFAYILNSNSTRCGISEAIVLKAKTANKPLPSHSGKF